MSEIFDVPKLKYSMSHIYKFQAEKFLLVYITHKHSNRKTVFHELVLPFTLLA